MKAGHGTAGTYISTTTYNSLKKRFSGDCAPGAVATRAGAICALLFDTLHEVLTGSLMRQQHCSCETVFLQVLQHVGARHPSTVVVQAQSIRALFRASQRVRLLRSGVFRVTTSR